MKKRKAFTLIELINVILIIIIILVIFFGPFTGFFVKEERAIHALEDAGYSEVEIIDRGVFFICLRGGDMRDTVKFTATALNPLGNPVETHVFSSWIFKYPTIRAKKR